MEFFTILAGALVGVLAGRRIAEHCLFLYYYYRNFATEEKFLDIYDLVDDEFHYRMYSATTKSPPKKYVDYLKLHQKLRPKAFSIYLSYIKQLKRHVLNSLVLVALIPSVLLFWTTWYFYLATFLVFVVGFSIFIRYKKDNGIDFHAILIVSLVFNGSTK